ncbi:RNA-binding protein 34 [Euwallacea similis]|uniref:RNA-binding protein 34 n=1 Tax=Euwallacea similis TaxID=1736056 RepID=UPI00344F4F91
MDYTVGSLADLISERNTPNKPKLVSKTFVKKKPKESASSPLTSNKGVQKKSKLNPSEVKGSSKPKKLKSNRKSVTGTKDASLNGNNENSTLKKQGKRKRIEVKDTNTESSDHESDNPSPKKPKLSDNENNAASRIKNKINKQTKNSSEYKNNTLFVGNIPIGIPKKEIQKHFRKHGEIDSVRIRGIPVADIKTSKKVAAIKKEFHPDRTSVFAYIRFKKIEDAKNAEIENGELFHGHHLRVQFCEEKTKHDESKAIFVGNLPFKAEDEELWNIFKPCGAISHVRVVRDGRTGIGKGFAYVNFKDVDSVQLALEMEKVMLKDRELRISLCDANRAKKLKQGKKSKGNMKVNGKATKGSKKNTSNNEGGKSAGFTGSKFNDFKKKKKFSKAVSEKKKLAKKLVAPKPKELTL